MTLRGHIKDGQIKLDDPAQLPEGAEVAVTVMERQQNGAEADSLDRNGILRLPIEQRRILLNEQSERVADCYKSDLQRTQWQGGDIIE